MGSYFGAELCNLVLKSGRYTRNMIWKDKKQMLNGGCKIITTWRFAEIATSNAGVLGTLETRFKSSETELSAQVFIEKSFSLAIN